jgi:hypothetical protein
MGSGSGAFEQIAFGASALLIVICAVAITLGPLVDDRLRSRGFARMPWLALCSLGAAVVASVMRAPGVAVALTLVAVVQWAQIRWESRGREDPDEMHEPVSWIWAGPVLAVLAFVLIGTMARQYVDPGVDLGRRPGFGGLDGLADAFVGRNPLMLLGLGCMAALVAISHRDGTPPDTEEGGER